MIAQEVAGKYARALFRSVQERGLADQGYEQFQQLRYLLSADKRLVRFLGAPQISETAKLETVRRLFEPRLEKLFVEFLVVLVQKRRSRFLLDIIEAFLLMLEEVRGITRATVITAVKLTAEQEKMLTERLAKRTGKTVLLEQKVDASIIGGLIVLLEGEMLDGSVRHGLNQIAEQLNRARVA